MMHHAITKEDYRLYGFTASTCAHSFSLTGMSCLYKWHWRVYISSYRSSYFHQLLLQIWVPLCGIIYCELYIPRNDCSFKMITYYLIHNVAIHVHINLPFITLGIFFMVIQFIIPVKHTYTLLVYDNLKIITIKVYSLSKLKSVFHIYIYKCYLQ